MTQFIVLTLVLLPIILYAAHRSYKRISDLRDEEWRHVPSPNWRSSRGGRDVW